MTQRRPFELKATHLARKAVVYVRQSSEAQVADNQGSTDYQRGQRQFAAAWGWAPELIEVVDVDLGLSGAAATHRHGYQRMLREMEAGQVGAVFVSDESRLGREPIAFFEFANVCLAKNVLLVVNGQVADLADPGKFFHARLTALLSEYENRRRRAHIVRGREARIAAGKAVSRPPTGYVWGPDGSWELDPDLDVQAAIQMVFQTFRRERSCPKTLRALQAAGIKIPRRPPGKGLIWREPTIGIFYPILKNPSYTGRYVYRRHISDPTRGVNARGAVRLRRARAEETITIPDHHPPYVPPAEWDEIQAILRAHAVTPTHQNLGPGSALLQGIVRCGKHRHCKMQVRYRVSPRDGQAFYYYRCLGDYDRGGKQCGGVRGARLDRAVVEAVLGRLAPPRIAALRAALREFERAHADRDRLQRAARDRTRRRVQDLEQRYFHVNPTHRLVAESLEAQLEAAKRELAVLDGAPPDATPPAPLSDRDVAELGRLAADAPALFDAPTTTHHDRKEIIRTLVERVTFLDRSAERITARITWADATPETTVTALTDAWVRRRILEQTDQGRSVTDILAWIRQAEHTTRLGTQWSRSGVREVIGRRRRKRARASDDLKRPEVVPCPPKEATR